MRRLLPLAMLPLALAACSSSSSDNGPVTPPVTPSISVVLSTPTGTVARSSSGSVAVILNRLGNYTGTVTLRAENLPSGVTGTFTSPTLAGTASATTLSLDVGASAVAGTTAITLRASGTGVADATTTYALTITAPAITLVAGSSSASAAQGASATVPLTITRGGGFATAVDLTAEGLPAGVTASFAPASLAAGVTTSTLTLTAAANATPGTASVIVRASGTGVTSQTATVAFTITSSTVADFALTASPASLALTGGATGTSAIAIARSGGFAGIVQLTLVGAPTGVTGFFTPNPTNASASVLTVATTSAVVAGTYNLTVLGQGTLPGFTVLSDRTTTISLTVSPVPAIVVAVGSSALTAAAGASATSTVSVARIGSFTGDVALTLENAPAGVVGAFTPSTLTTGLTASTLALTVGANTTPGSYALNVRATGTGVTSQTATITLTVTAAAPPQNYTLAASGAAAQQGATATSTVTITRTGNFAGSVALSVSGLPGAVAATFTPSATTGNTSTLSLAVGSAVAAGTYSGTITGTATGLGNVTTTVTLTVTSSGGGGAIAWQFCDPRALPLWFAFQDGAGGAWTRVLPNANNSYSFTINASTGGVAYATPQTGGVANVTMQLGTTAEITASGAAQCASTGAKKTVNATLAGLPAGGSGTAFLGGGSGSSSANNTPFAITNAGDGPADLLATRTAFDLNTFSISVDRAILRRGINPAAGSTITPTLDFNAAEAFAPATATVTLTNAGADNIAVITSFQSSNGAVGSFVTVSTMAGATRTAVGVPSSRTQAGDLHGLFVTATAADQSSRVVLIYNRDLVAKSIALGATPGPLTVTGVSGGAYARIRLQGSWQAEYGDIIGGGYTQTTLRSWNFTISRGYSGAGGTFDFTLPDFSTVPGFDTNWGLRAGVQTGWATSVTGYLTSFANGIVEGSTLRLGSRNGTITP